MARRILLADDSVTAQNMGRRILQDAGYEVTTVNNGSAALKRIAELHPDLIILDVYMPGYGGLEVCSRLKENKDTARIPVLLTVGKLEPFKPEEARRVKADAYIVKPFEASELLTALTKLEDKIVPGPEPYKQGRFAKAMAAVEHSGSEADFGDQETGWKDRLIIPGGKKKKDKDAEPEAEPVPAKGFRSVVREEEFRPAEPKKGFERPMPAGLPQDIKPEEIAAIAAAAAKINGKSAEVETPASPVEETKAWPAAEASAPVEEVVARQPTEKTEEEVPAATFASAHEDEETPAAKTELESQAAVAVEPSVEAPPEPVAPVEVVAEVAPVVEAAAPEAQPDGELKPEVEARSEVEAKRPVSDAEVLAALASLTPAGTEFATAAADAAIEASFTGPRWAAEAVALAEEESTTLLEHEMEKVHAALAAADAATPVEAVVPSNGNGHGPEVNAESAPEVPKPQDTSATPEPASEPTVEAVATGTVAPVVEEAAYAAAASASAAPAEGTIDNKPVAFASTSVSSEPEEGSRVREAELAAAWANWRQIRESIVGELPTTHVEDAEAGFREMPLEAPAEVAAEMAVTPEAVQEPAVADPQPEATHEEQPAPEVQSEAIPSEAVLAEAPERDPAEISSIVDNMLAELKPRLMEELKRKLRK